MKIVTLGIISVGIVIFAGPAAFAQRGSATGEKKPPAAQETKGSSAARKAPSPQDASRTPQVLDAGDAAEVQKYSDALARAGLPPQDVKALVGEETQERLAKKQMKATSADTKKGSESGSAPGSPASGGAPGSSSHGLGSYVQTLLNRGLHGRELADAIHAEQKRRQESQGNGEGAEHGVATPGHPGKPGKPGKPGQSAEHGSKAPGTPKPGAGHHGDKAGGGQRPVNNAGGKGSGHGKGKKT